MTTNDQNSLGDEGTLAAVRKRRPEADVSLGDERTLGGGGGELDTRIDNSEVVDLEARYKIEGTLGQGGMGAVLLATDTRLDRKVAIKRILGEAAGNRMAVQRFLTEAKAIAALNHPNIVQIYELGWAKDGPFLIMEYVDGGSLLDRCRESALPLDKAIDLACQLCDGLAKAHDLGIIHRDIKPANVLLTKDGTPKLTDFGLAKAQASDHGQTVTGAVLGTPDFMPPEQRRDASLVDHRSDLWSLAATIYQMVTGRSPKIIRFDLLPSSLTKVLGQALEDAKDTRYQSARELRDALKTSLRSAAAVEELIEGACPACGVKNESSRRFCRGCGESLEAPCLSCNKPMPMWEEICGECGGKQTPLVEQRRQAMAAKQAEAEGLLGDFEFARATAIAEQLRDEGYPKLRYLSAWATRFLEQVEKARTDQTRQAIEAVAEAVKHEAAHDYLSAAFVLDAIPETMRSQMLPGVRETAAQMLERIRKNQGEVRRLESLIKGRLAAKKFDDLLPDVESFLRLQPARTDVVKIRTQLLERQSKQAAVREESLAAARDSLAHHDYEKALASLTHIATPAVTPEVVALREEADGLVQKVRALTKRIKEALSAKQLDGLLPAVEEYLRLKPGDAEVAKVRQSLHEREKRVTSDIASRFEQATQLERKAQFAKAAQLLQVVPEPRRSAELQACLDRTTKLTALQTTAMNALNKAQPGTYGEALEGCRTYRATLEDANLADAQFASLYDKANAAHDEEQRTRRMLFMTAAVAAGIMAAVVSVGAGLWIRSAMRASAVAAAIRSGRWDEALAITPDNPEALAGRADERLRASPPDIKGVFADLEKAERGTNVPASIKSIRARAHAIRAAQQASLGEVDQADNDLQAAIRGGAAEGVIGLAKDEIAKVWLARVEKAAAEGDGAAIRSAAAPALAAGADRAAVLQLWQEYAQSRISKLDATGLELACAEAKKAGLAVTQAAEWWVRFGVTAAAPPHEHAADVVRAVNAALAAGAERAALLGVWQEYVKGRISKLDAKGVELACAEAKKVGLSRAAEADWWIRFGATAAAPPHEHAAEVIRAVDAASAAGGDRSSLLAVWQTYASSRIAKQDAKGLESMCFEARKVGLTKAAEAELWIHFGQVAIAPPHENTSAVKRAVEAALAAGASTTAVAPLRAKAMVITAVVAQANGDSTTAVSALLEASLLDASLVHATLIKPPYATLRQAVIADYRSRFEAAVTAGDWETALGITAAAETVAPFPPQVLASLPRTVMLRLPPMRNSIGMELKLLPAGRFTMGEAGGQPEGNSREVRLWKPFYLGLREVTNAQWKRVMGRVPSQWQDDEHPVESIKWEDAVAFSQKLSSLPEERAAGRAYRLPTEKEWEYACRAGTTTNFSFGDDESRLGEYAWYGSNAGGQPHPVGKKKPNAWGLYDMHGNVWEWCNDRDKSVTNVDSRGYRGGGWYDDASSCRSACVASAPSHIVYRMGFRVAMSPSGAEPVPPEGPSDGGKNRVTVDLVPPDLE